MPYMICNSNSGLYLDVPNGSSDDGVQIQQYQYHDVPAQHWQIIRLYADPTDPQLGTHPDWAGPYLIVSEASSRALDDWEASVADNDPIMQFQVHGGQTSGGISRG